MKPKLAFFDIDETVFHTFAKIRIIKNGKIIKYINNKDFNSYKLKRGESFDFTEFRDSEVFFNTSVPINNVIKIIKRNIVNNNKVIFLTAREDFKDKSLFLETFRKYGIDIDKPNVYIERSGNLKHIHSVSERKIEIIKKYLHHSYQEVKMYDDDVKNLLSFKDLLKQYHYNAKAIQVIGNGKLKQI